MKITIISMWHNEARLAPFFLGHYAYADEIRLIVGKDTTDDTLEICSRYPNVEIEEFTFPDGLLNDTLKIKKFNEVARTLDCDWLMALDADEFIFPPREEDVRQFLGRQNGNLLWAEMYQVYRHVTDFNLDPGRPALSQRLHGNTKPHHIKPVIVKPETEIEWGIGHHGYKKSEKTWEASSQFLGTHWARADADIAIERYIKGRRDRMSEENLEKGYGYHTFDLTEEKIRAECEQHLNDPLLFSKKGIADFQQCFKA